MQKIYFLLPLLLVCFVFVGCEKQNFVKTNRVKGIVSLKGVPLDGATISFHSADGAQNPPASGITDADGKYELSAVGGAANAGAVPGKYTVTVTKAVGVTKEVPGEKDSYGNPRMETTYTEIVPKQYLSKSTSTLEATVSEEGVNEFNFDLTD